jgi:feruloyl esterase
MSHRSYLVGAAMGLFACIAFAGTPAMATPCTNLQSLQLQDTAINSATDNTTGVFVVPGSNPPSTITGLLPGHRDPDPELGFQHQDRGLAA